ncbi:MAG: hypothetical protein D3910_02330 [Candidatus Electrothrix sp. ATG2]|nr:hypothetical protein [Candidatus Electrothrix sp. ATG2]
MKFGFIKTVKTVKHVTLLLLCVLYVVPVRAADSKKELLTLEAAENIKFLSQKTVFCLMAEAVPAAKKISKGNKMAVKRADRGLACFTTYTVC